MDALGNRFRNSQSAASSGRSPRRILEDQNIRLALEDAAHGVLAQIPLLGELSREEVPLKQT
ncbi:MAG: hypothetical protein DMG58_20030 [Acidobacteria bacterium]|nr:MAG: hypothetical protein DMG58_20030 [Acidobacteriota bacterium]